METYEIQIAKSLMNLNTFFPFAADLSQKSCFLISETVLAQAELTFC